MFAYGIEILEIPAVLFGVIFLTGSLAVVLESVVRPNLPLWVKFFRDSFAGIWIGRYYSRGHVHRLQLAGRGNSTPCNLQFGRTVASLQ